METVGLYSEADQGAPHLAQCTDTAALAGVTAQDTYLNVEAVLRALHDHRCDAVHPGYGFLSENAAFARAVQDAGATFIGPDAQWLEKLGNKVAAREVFADHGFPVGPGSAIVSTLEQAIAEAHAIGYPVLLKPAEGGGGIGMQVARDDEELATALQRTQALAESAFGSSATYLERWIESARHIEFQMLADRHGGCVHVYERDCSLQRRNQKVVEEAPAPGLERDAVDAVAARAETVLGELGYDNVGTVETLLAPDGEFAFLEVNTRIQVEHAVTEMVTGMDLVAHQIRLAAGHRVPARPPLNGHAVEARVYAEDPVSFRPSTGKLTRFRLPALQGVRVEKGYGEGQFVTAFYDPMLAKVVAWGHHVRRQLAGCWWRSRRSRSKA